MLPTKYWADMTWPDFQRADMSRVIAVLPAAAMRHGVDRFIMLLRDVGAFDLSRFAPGPLA